MPLPEGFSPWEHLQDVLMQSYNRVVREEFSDLGNSDDDDDISTPRNSLKTACKIVENDSIPQALMRMLLFYFVLRKAQDLQTPVYGIPLPSYQEARKFRPQIQLYFQEDAQDIEEGYAPVTGEITFRLMNESSETLTESEVSAYANRVKNAFASGGGFRWAKGKLMCSYTDNPNGYKLQLLCRNKTEARRVVEQVLDIQQHAPNFKYLNVSENEEPAARYPTIPPNQLILGRARREPRARPIADVRFQYALLHIHGLPHPIVLVDRTGVFRQPLVDSRS